MIVLARRPRPRFGRLVLLCLITAAVTLSCSSSDRGAASAPTAAAATTTPFATSARAAGVPTLRHVVVVVFENEEADNLTTAAAPYLAELASRYASLSRSYAVTHPSLPNYLALVGGDTFGIASDCTNCFIKDAPNIATQLEDAGQTWKAYMDGMPRPCFVGDAGRYAQKHNPFIYFDTIRLDPRRCNQIVPFSEFAADLAAGRLPNFAWVTPDLCHDMHDCDVATGEAWLRGWLPGLLASPAFQDGAVVITFDEGHSNAGCCRLAAGGRVQTLVLSPFVRPGAVSTMSVSHYALLRTLEAALGLPPLANAGCDCSPAITDIWR